MVSQRTTQLFQGSSSLYFKGMKLMMHSKQLISVKYQLVNKKYFQIQDNPKKDVLINGIRIFVQPTMSVATFEFNGTGCFVLINCRLIAASIC